MENLGKIPQFKIVGKDHLILKPYNRPGPILGSALNNTVSFLLYYRESVILCGHYVNNFKEGSQGGDCLAASLYHRTVGISDLVADIMKIYICTAGNQTFKTCMFWKENH